MVQNFVIFSLILLVKAGQLQLPVDKFIALNLELEVDRAGAEGIKIESGFNKVLRISIQEKFSQIVT